MEVLYNNKTSPYGYGDSALLAEFDRATQEFQEDEDSAKKEIIEKMLTLRNNMKYNKHLRGVYEKAKGVFDTMVEEHRAQVQSLDEIHRHLHKMIRDELATSGRGRTNHKVVEMMKIKPESAHS